MTGGDANDRSPRRLLVCVNPVGGANKPCCGGDRGSEALAATLEREIAARGIRCGLARIHCLNKCLKGPAMRLAPGGDFLLGMTAADLPALLDRLEAECGTEAGDDAGGLPPGLYPGA